MPSVIVRGKNQHLVGECEQLASSPSAGSAAFPVAIARRPTLRIKFPDHQGNTGNGVDLGSSGDDLQSEKPCLPRGLVWNSLRSLTRNYFGGTGNSLDITEILFREQGNASRDGGPGLTGAGGRGDIGRDRLCLTD